MDIECLRELLHEVRRRAGQSFSGVGLLVSDDISGLPIVPLRPFMPAPHSCSTRETLIKISDHAQDLHDGFHILTSDLELLKLSQYFSPPIVPGLKADPQRRLGGRYMAAMFGSALPQVLASGVASADYGVAVFEHGHEVPAR